MLKEGEVCGLTKSHKICKVWALVNQVLPWYFPSYGLWLTIQIIQSVDISGSIEINQSILVNQFYLIKASSFIRYFFIFPYFTIIKFFNSCEKSLSPDYKWKAWYLCCNILKLLMIIQQTKRIVITNLQQLQNNFCQLSSSNSDFTT